MLHNAGNEDCRHYALFMYFIVHVSLEMDEQRVCWVHIRRWLVPRMMSGSAPGASHADSDV